MSSSSNQAENGHKYFFLLDFTFTFHAGTWYFPPTSRDNLMQKTVTYIQGSCSFSQMQNIFPPLQGKNKKKKGRGRRGGDIKDRLIFCAIYWLVLSQPSHYIMSKIVNKQITTAHRRPQRGSGTWRFLWRSLCRQLRRKKTFVFTVHLNNTYLFLYREKGCTRIYMNHCLWPG